MKLKIERNQWLVVRVKADKGEFGSLWVSPTSAEWTPFGTKVHQQFAFPIRADGEFHTYNVWLGESRLMPLKEGQEYDTSVSYKFRKLGTSLTGSIQQIAILPTCQSGASGVVSSIAFVIAEMPFATRSRSVPTDWSMSQCVVRTNWDALPPILHRTIIMACLFGNADLNRRRFLVGSTVIAGCSLLTVDALAADPKSRSLFDGKTLKGWRAIPRLAVPQAPSFAKIPANELKEAVVAWHQAKPEQQARLAHTGRWEVVDGAIIGGHEPPESMQGAYLISEQKFSDFELELEARPDWPVDTGIMIRAHELGSVGFQILLDHRPKGGVGGVFGNGIGGFLAAPFTLDGDKLPNFKVANLREGEREGKFKAPKMDYVATFSDFGKVWHENDWNHFRIRCVGRLPTITTWVNGFKLFELDTSKIDIAGFDAEQVLGLVGRSGHIAFEVHDVNLNNPLGQDRWATGAVCRWRNINITELS